MYEIIRGCHTHCSQGALSINTPKKELLTAPLLSHNSLPSSIISFPPHPMNNLNKLWFFPLWINKLCFFPLLINWWCFAFEKEWSYYSHRYDDCERICLLSDLKVIAYVNKCSVKMCKEVEPGLKSLSSINVGAWLPVFYIILCIKAQWYKKDKVEERKIWSNGFLYYLIHEKKRGGKPDE